MAIEVNLGQTDDLFIGGDYFFEFEIFEDDDATPKDASGLTFEYVQRRYVDDPLSVIRKFSGAGISVTGVFDVDPTANTQRVVVTLLAADSAAVKPGVYQHALWRIDAGFFTPATTGAVTWQRATATGPNPP